MKKLLSILLVALMALSLVACASQPAAEPSKAPAADPADGPAAADPTMEPVAEEPDTKKLVLYTSAGAAEYELIVGLFNEKYPDIEIEIVSGGTGEVRVKFGGCHKIITAAHHGARRYASANVHGSKIINIIYDTCIDHRPRATRTFLCRLKNQFDDAM